MSGFIIIGQKLSGLSENVKTLEEGIHNTENLLIDDLITDAQELSREFTRIMNRIKDKREVNDDELERLLMIPCGDQCSSPYECWYQEYCSHLSEAKEG